MQLRDYQIDLIDKVKKSYKSGHNAPCIVLPCGGGKSVIVAEIAKRTTNKGNNVLFLVHRKELCEQIHNTFENWGVNMSLCTIGMVQTICRHIDKMIAPSLIITDENHHSLANSYKKIYDAFPKAKRVGVTATPVRLNGSGLGDVNDELIVGVSARYLIDNDFLAPYDYYAPSSIDLSGVKISKGEYNAAMVEKLVIQKAIFGDVITNYKKLADSKQAICYCTTVNHSKTMEKEFNKAGIDARHIDGETPKEERSKIIDMFRNKQIDILCNVDLISEGFDVPDCECAILLRPTKSLTLYIQQSMRCMRYKPNKRAIIIDCVGNYLRFGLPDDSRSWSLDGKKKNDNFANSDIKTCTSCFGVFSKKDNIISFQGALAYKCPYCKAIIPIEGKPRKPIKEITKSELIKVTSFQIDYTTPDDCNSYQELLAYAEKRNYKKGWAYYQAKRRGILQ